MRRRSNVLIDYRATTVEEMGNLERFDIVLAMEVIEHVTDVGLFLQRCATLMKPQGMMVVVDAEPHAEELCAGDRRR